MKHRHIDDDTWSVAALHSLFERGDLPDWQELFQALVDKDPGLEDRLVIALKLHPDLQFFVDVIVETAKSTKP